MNDTIAAVVVTYNRKALLLDCIKSLIGQVLNCDIYIVDNDSTDGTYDYIKDILTKYSNIHYCKLNRNIGGAGGFNYGIKWVMQFDYKFIWLMDDDCIPMKNALEELMHADLILNSHYGYLASEVLWIDQSLCKMNIPKYKRYFHNISRYPRLKQATFVSLLIKTEVIKIVGLPIKDFFIWGDDIEYTRRISQKYKFPSYYVSNSKVIHCMKDNKGSNIAIDTMDRLYRYELAYRNEFYLYRQEGLIGIFYYHLKIIYNCLKIIILAKNNKLKRLKILFNGYQYGFKFKPKVEFMRIKNDKQ